MKNCLLLKLKSRTKQLLLIGVFLISIQLSAMPMSETIELKLNNKTLLEALTTIEKLTEYKFVYNNKDVDVTKTVNVDTEFESIEEFTNTLLSEYNVSVRGNNVIITKKAEDIASVKQTAERNVIGQIVDARTGETVIGANIWIRESSKGTVTDIDGRFSMPVSNNSTVLVITYIGYEELVVEVGNRTDLGVIEMDVSDETLDEVVVIGYGT